MPRQYQITDDGSYDPEEVIAAAITSKELVNLKFPEIEDEIIRLSTIITLLGSKVAELEAKIENILLKTGV